MRLACLAAQAHAGIRLPRLIAAACVSRIPPSKPSASMIAVAGGVCRHGRLVYISCGGLTLSHHERLSFGWRYISCMHARYHMCALRIARLARTPLPTACLRALHAFVCRLYRAERLRACPWACRRWQSHAESLRAHRLAEAARIRSEEVEQSRRGSL